MKTNFKSNLFVLLTVCLSLFFGVNSKAQILRPFTQRAAQESPTRLIYNIKGDFTMIGNVNLMLDSYDDNQNNSFPMQYVDIDGDPSTFNSSSAELTFSTENGAIPECSNIIFAGLYWSGRAHDGGTSPMEFDVTKGGVTKTFNKRKVKLKGPGQPNYTEFTASSGDIYYPSSTHGNMYSGFVEVTDYVRNAGLGNYTVADLALREGAGGGTGFFGGWGLIVVYENSKMNWRDVTVFDGHAYVAGGVTASYELPISGFNTVQSGPVNMKLGLMAGEGDRGISGDYFQIRNHPNTSWVTLSHAGNSTNNFFNSSIFTGGNTRNPSLLNNTGMDISMFNIPNPSNSVITNSQTSTRFRYGSNQDTYVIFCTAMSVDAYIPDVEALVSSETINGVPAAGVVSVEPGDIIEYSVELRNLGTEGVENVLLTVPVPYTSTFVTGSISATTNFLPAPSPNNAYFDPNMGPTGSVVWELEYLPLPADPDDVLATLTFEFEVTDDCFVLTNPDCAPRVILSGGTITGIGSVSGSNFRLPFIQGYEDAGLCIGEPISEPIVLEIDADAFVAANCSGFPMERNYLFCNYNEASIPFDSIAQFFPVGLGFYNTNVVGPESIIYDENNPFPATPGTQTYYAIPYGINLCYYSFTITVQAPITSSAVATSPESCIGAADGSISLIVTGGTAPLSFEWTGPSPYTSTSQNISDLGAGLYEAVITDALTCTANASATIELTPDVTLPIIICPAPISDNNILGTCGAEITYTTPVGTDNCPGASTTLLQGLASGSIFPVGTTLVEYEVEDLAGNTASCSFNVTVFDNELPTITCPGPVNAVADLNECTVDGATVNLGTPVTGDNCGVASVTNNAPAFYPVGTTIVTWTVTDVHGNFNTCEQNVVVEDNQAPSFVACVGSDQTVDTDLNECTYTMTTTAWDATATDNCTTVTLGYVLTGATTGSGTTLNGVTFNRGTTTVTWTATDGSTNTETCVFDVVVEDNQAPSFVACVGSDQTVDTDLNECTYTMTTTAWDATATDNCTTVTLGYVLTGATTGSGTTLNGVTFNRGTTTVTWTATDGSSNTETCVFDVVVEDNQLPSFTSCIGSAQTVETDIDECSYTMPTNAWDATATDNCTTVTLGYVLTGATTGSGTTLNGVTFNLGTTTVTWTATDGSSNTETCVFDVVVEDNQLPEIIGCLSDFSANNDATSCGANVSWNVPTFTDNCTGASMTASHTPGDYFTVGSTEVVYVVTDGSGNQEQCSFFITVLDNEAPIITCPTPAGTCDPLVTYDAPVASDNCGVATIEMTAGLASGSEFPVGITPVTYVVTDIHGNQNSCTFNVEVYPLPELNLVATDVTCFGANDGVINLSVSNGLEPYSYEWSNGADTEDLAGLAPGAYNVTVTDANGCSMEASTSISQPDPLAVTSELTHALCNSGDNGSIDLSVNGGVAPYTFAWSNDATTEDISNLLAGTYTVVITDANACTLDYAAVINEPSSLDIQHQVYNSTCNAPNGSIQAQVVGGVTPYSYEWSDGSTNLNLNNVVAGVYTLVVTDANGCTSEVTDTIFSESNILAEVTSSDVTCFGRNNGVARVSVIAGNAPFSYQWSTGDTTAIISGLAPGVYTVVVTDVYGCEADLIIEILEPELLEVTLEPSLYSGGYNVFPYDGDNGFIDAIVSGGTEPYSFYWNDGQSTSGISNLTAGTYSVVVADDNGCAASATIDLNQPLILEMPNGYSPNGDGKNDYFVVRGLDGYPSNEFTVYNRWGNIVYQRNDYDNTWNGENNFGEPLPDATYFVILNVESASGTITLKGYVDLRR